MEVDHLVDVFLCENIPAPAVLDIAVDDRVLTGAALGAAGLVHRNDLRALLRSGTDSRHTGNTAADDQNVGADLLLHVRVRDLRGFAEPLTVRRRLRCLVTDCGWSRAFSLGDAVVDCRAHGITGDGRAGYRVHFPTLRVKNSFFKQWAGSAAELRRLAGGVDHDIKDAGLVKGHSDGDFALKSLGFCGIGAGDIFCFLCVSHQIGARTEYARSRKTEGSCGGSLQKISA